MREDELRVGVVEVEADDVGQVGDGRERSAQRLGVQRDAPDLGARREDQVLGRSAARATVRLEDQTVRLRLSVRKRTNQLRYNPVGLGERLSK